MTIGYEELSKQVWERRRDSQRRRAIKWQLRKKGVKIPLKILYDVHALRKLRREL